MKSFDPTKAICNHLIGENHTKNHKLTIGAFIMIIGVIVSKIAFMFGNTHILVFLTDTFGYLIHGVGAMPYIELILKIGKNGT